jgi:hypothetical protein
MNIPKLSFSRQENLSPRAFIAMMLLCVLCIRGHEYSHIVSLLIQGRDFTSAFGSVSPSGDDNRVVSNLGGPLFTYVVMWMGLILLLHSLESKRGGFILIFASLPLFRLFGYMFSTIPSGDETSIARALHIPDPIAAGIVVTIVLPPLVIAYASIDSRRRILWFLFLFVALPIFSAIVITLLGDRCIIPLVKSSRLRGTPISTMVHGIPLIVLLLDAALITIFLLVSRPARQSTPPIQ